MPIPITMPRLSDTMEQGTVVKWNVKVGDKVSSGDVLADIETDKATMELQSFDDGVVAKLSAQEGQKINVGETILVLAADGEAVEDGVVRERARLRQQSGKDESRWSGPLHRAAPEHGAAREIPRRCVHAERNAAELHAHR